MQPFEIKDDIGFLLANFKRVWPFSFLALLSCKVAEVMARLTKQNFSDYDCVKASTIKRCRLSTEVFHHKFKNGEKELSQSYADFAYTLRANMVE